ncbi:hypothetical protein [Hymenobacter sp. HDW8]|uniref:hypothetical protein n=1 Tax=Hymenobacter sp. HDW8 TaxID=2714932 RepID=UPI00140B6273|nr:hypothetical protein [Hymenobacter sp. HDW8]QIL75424.1 hypothetical protein G7064_05855 [Hymenobacter sp. HDW8]
MAKRITLLKVFLASPSDVIDERAIAEEVIEDFNLTTGEYFDVRLELVKWETHTYPGIGEDGQDVINKQLKDDYDIFVGIMWKKFGYPTKRFDSGTAEEFNRAYEKFRDDPTSSHIMFYFCNRAPASIDDIDTDQLKSVRDFKSMVSDMGLLYHKYEGVKDFEKLLKLHLNRVVLEIVENDQMLDLKVGYSKDKSKDIRRENKIRDDEDEKGILDYFIEGKSYIDLGVKSLHSIISYQNDFTSKIKKQDQYLTFLGSSTALIDISTKMDLSNLFAADLQGFADKINPELDRLESNFNKGIELYTEALQYYYEIGVADVESLKSNFKEFDGFDNNISIAKSGINVFKNSIDDFPKLNSNVIKARKEASASLGKLLSILDSMNTLVKGYSENLKKIIDDIESNDGGPEL